MGKSGSVAVLLSATVLIMGCTAERNEAGEIVEGGAVDAFSIQVGDCYNDRTIDVGDVDDVSGTPCSEPHDNEVYALFDVELAEFPGRDSIDSIAEAGCLERFQAYVGATYEESVIALTYLFPSAESWRQGEDREVVCAAYHMDGEKLEGSVRNSGM